MAYVYQVSFDIHPEQMNELEIGASLERVLSYLRALLPGEAGYITSRAMSSLDDLDRTHVIVQSVWDHWEDLSRHRQSSLAEDKVLSEFEPHVTLEDLVVHAYEEVA
jgi:hypothetical protein